MSTASRRVSLQKHSQMGRMLKDMRDAIQPLICELPYPKGSPAIRKLSKAIRDLDELRCVLDSQAAKDLGHEFSTRIYYPGQNPEGNLYQSVEQTT